MIKTWYGTGTSFVETITRTFIAMMSSVYHIIFWPFEMHRKKFLSEARYLTSYGKERVKARIKAEDATIVSGRSQMIEVCSESSFQPLLQLYLFLPTLIVSFRNLGSKVHICFVIRPARRPACTLRALGLLQADGALKVGEGEDFLMR